VFGYSSDIEEESGLPVFAHVGFPHRRKKKYVDTRSLWSLIVDLGGNKAGTLEPAQPANDALTPPLATQPPTIIEFKEERTDEDEPPLQYIHRPKTEKKNE
jgi:hypothetical protein